MKQIGKVQRETNNAVARWKRKQKPNHQGYYVCYICGKWVTYLMAEHVKSKTRSPDNRTNPENFNLFVQNVTSEKAANHTDYAKMSRGSLVVAAPLFTCLSYNLAL